MRNLTELDNMRDRSEQVLEHYGSFGDYSCGVFWVRSKQDGTLLRVIASAGNGWDHVSVSHQRRVPNWYEMEQVKRLFFKDDETVVQFHVPPKDHVNIHANVLHLWRAVDEIFPMPPSIMV